MLPAPAVHNSMHSDMQHMWRIYRRSAALARPVGARCLNLFLNMLVEVEVSA
jgi:hypothetical protein